MTGATGPNRSDARPACLMGAAAQLCGSVRAAEARCGLMRGRSDEGSEPSSRCPRAPDDDARREHRLPVLPAPGAGGAPCPRCSPAAVAAIPDDLTVVLAPPPVDDTAELEPVLGFPAEAEPGRGPARRPDARVVAAGAAALVLVGGAAVLGLRATGAGDAATTPQGAPAAAAVVPVDAADVRVEASTTQQPDNGITYDAANTLDGRPETAWNSDGQGAGATLVYTFAQPVDLRTITVLNGYQKVRAGSSGRVDLFALNERVRTFTVVTDAGSRHLDAPGRPCAADARARLRPHPHGEAAGRRRLPLTEVHGPGRVRGPLR